jgi:transposase
LISVGIDVAKRTHEACFMDAAGQEVDRPLRFPNTAAGVATLSERLRRLEQPVSIALEATGHYWLALHERLTQEGFPVQVVNPIQTDAYRRTTVRKVKSDRRDSWIVADFHRIGRVRPGYVPDVTILQLRELTRFRFKLVDQVGAAKRKVLTVLDRVFPEYERLFSDVFIVTSRQLLRTATTAEEFAEFDLDELATLLRRSSRGRFGRDKAQGIQMAARNSLGLSSLGPVAALELRWLLDQIEFLEAQIAQVEAAIEELMAALEQDLTTIKGLGPVLAATILAEIGDIHRFSRLESLVAYAGIDPAVYSSGEFTGTQAKLSKRGSPHLRRALWLAAASASRYNPDLQEYFERKIKAGKPYKVVMSAISRKLLARIYVVLKENRPYEVR